MYRQKYDKTKSDKNQLKNMIWNDFKIDKKN